MSKRTREPERPGPAALRVAEADADMRLQEQIERGKQVCDLAITDLERLEEVERTRDRWRDFCRQLLVTLFTTAQYQEEFDGSQPSVRCVIMGGGIILREEIEEHRNAVNRYLNMLESLRERLPIIPKLPGVAQTAGRTPQTPKLQGKKVFIVHGHDEEAKQTVARYLESLDLAAVILHEQPSGGRTLIEKLSRGPKVFVF